MLDLHLKLQIMATVSDKCLVKMEKALNLWVSDMDRKCVLLTYLIDSNMLCQKALGLYKYLSPARIPWNEWH